MEFIQLIDLDVISFDIDKEYSRILRNSRGKSNRIAMGGRV
ncbi:hypothetical protein FHS15_002787 [Paenibacillus castaneae]|nr:hypothetical protein [Paenibacillus castaneae]